MKKTVVIIFSALVLAAGWSCKPSANPNAAPNLLSYVTPTPAGTATNTPTPCPFLGADGNPTGSGNLVSKASGPATFNSYYMQGFYTSFSVPALSFQAIVKNSGASSEKMFAAIYDSSTSLVANSTVTFTVAAGSSYQWQKVDFPSMIGLPPGSYTLFVWVTTTGPDVSLGYSTYTNGCQLGSGLTTNISGFPSLIGGTSTATSTNSFGLLVSACP